ncbi:hypothetical protein D9757_007443 [Collybiopsis confluens]|uniref:Uncharacterized protein n=1 Tax=Collybiopsis confluens TaxID=2823264 RepID=A0A8H5HK35_9AGAR|nr:hypothetical protein D9757_007443 [Collybiopsis confluens]
MCFWVSLVNVLELMFFVIALALLAMAVSMSGLHFRRAHIAVTIAAAPPNWVGFPPWSISSLDIAGGGKLLYSFALVKTRKLSRRHVGLSVKDLFGMVCAESWLFAHEEPGVYALIVIWELLFPFFVYGISGNVIRKCLEDVIRHPLGGRDELTSARVYSADGSHQHTVVLDCHIFGYWVMAGWNTKLFNFVEDGSFLFVDSVVWNFILKFIMVLVCNSSHLPGVIGSGLVLGYGCPICWLLVASVLLSLGHLLLEAFMLQYGKWNRPSPFSYVWGYGIYHGGCDHIMPSIRSNLLRNFSNAARASLWSSLAGRRSLLVGARLKSPPHPSKGGSLVSVGSEVVVVVCGAVVRDWYYVEAGIP